MANLTRYSERDLRNDLARSYDNMGLATQVAAAGVREIASIHTYGGQKVAHTLAAAHRLVDSAGAISQSQEEQLYYRTQRYLSDMLRVADSTAAAIVAQMRYR